MAWAMADGADTPVGRIVIDIGPLTCGEEADPDEPPYCNYKPRTSVEQGDSAWASACDAEGYTPLQGEIEGGKAYTAYVTLLARQGYCFNADTRVMLYDPERMEYETMAPLLAYPGNAARTEDEGFAAARQKKSALR